MVAGHYAVSFAVKAVDRQIPLWLLFIAAQFVDVLWAIFVLLGVENLRIVPGITASHPFDLYYMPYSHSLLASLLWAGLAFLGYKLLASPSSSRIDRSAFFLALAVFSHWFLDLVVHRQDLPLYNDVYKMGLGLWNYPIPAFLVEAAVLFGGMWLYLRSTRGAAFAGKYAMLLFGAGMLLIQGIVFFGAPPRSPVVAVVMLVTLYAVCTWGAFWLEKKRSVPARPHSDAS